MSKQIGKNVRIKNISKIIFIKSIDDWASVSYCVWIKNEQGVYEKRWIPCHDINSNDLKSKKWGNMIAKLDDIDGKLHSHNEVMLKCESMKGQYCPTRVHFDVNHGEIWTFKHSFKRVRFGGHKIRFLLNRFLPHYCSNNKLNISTHDVCNFILSLYIFSLYYYYYMMRICV